MQADQGYHERRRALLGFGLKLLVTALLITWLVRSGALDFSRLSVLVRSPRVLLATCAAWLGLGVVLGTSRWQRLLRAAGFALPWARAAALHTTGLFFNAIVPGNVGGDLLKNRAVLGNRAAQLLVLVFAERVLGLISLVWLGTFGFLVNYRTVLAQPALYPVVLALGGLFVGSVVGPWAVRLILRRFRPVLQKNTAVERSGLLGLLRRALLSAGQALDLFRESRRQVALAFLVSLCMQAGNLSFFAFLTWELENPDASLSLLSMIFPIGVLSLIVPISVSGLGVGHVVFEHLFGLMGLSGGANTFNVYIVAQLAPSLLGALAFLFTGQRHLLREVADRGSKEGPGSHQERLTSSIPASDDGSPDSVE